jgi:lipoprotein-anchoring transpeptidase ErfK/SrfK
VAVFNDLLARQRYYTARSRLYGGATQRAVMAFRKVNGMRRTYDANRRIFRRLAARRGGFQLARPRAGRHVEVDISRQVMVLAARGKPRHVFHVSTGAPATPSDRGVFRFYRRQPGYNSLGMYYSVYYNRGEAIHGYRSVPGYPASHGCVRNPIPNSRFIYEWVRLRMRIYVHR